IPRNDKEDQRAKYAVAMLVLFKPWSDHVQNLLKEESQDWESAFEAWRSNTSAEILKTMKNMQLLYESRDAKVD
ncbi:hypothetical protein K435DRAFT_585534, partial [Dendrothele bispora CBS 962.96]